MYFCPTNCVTVDLVPNPASGCFIDQRNTQLSRILFMSCKTDLPNPITCNNITPLFSDNSIVVSAPLRNITLDDPTTQDVLVSDCVPPRKLVTARVLNWEDSNAISETSGSPAVTNAYYDYTFWLDKIANNDLMRYALVYCNGDVRFARAKSGVLLTANLFTFINYEKLAPGAGAIEFKKGTLTFAGDPLGAMLAPDFNLVECGIVL